MLYTSAPWFRLWVDGQACRRRDFGGWVFSVDRVRLGGIDWRRHVVRIDRPSAAPPPSF